MDTNVKSIDQFVARYPKNVQVMLQKIRQTIKQACPEAGEKIAYGIPTLTYHGNLVHFSAYDKHIGFYPGPYPISQLKNELKPYKTSKGTVRFPIDKPIPYDLIAKTTHLAAQRNLERHKK